jgi:hypothetical protein
MMRRPFRSLIPLTGVVVAIAGAVAAVSLGDPSGAVIDRPGAFAVFGIGAALAVMALAVVLLAAADRADSAEVGFVGTGLLGMAVLLLVNGTVTADVFYDRTPAFAAALTLSGPVFVVGALPLLARGTAFSLWAARRWRDWSLLNVLGSFVVAFGLAGLPELVSLPDGRHPVNLAIAAAAGVAIGVVASRMAVRRGAGVPGFAGAWWSLALLAVAATALPLAEPFGLGFWVLRALCLVGGVGTAVCGLAVLAAARQSRQAFGAVLELDPLLGLDLAVSPTVARATAADALGPEAVDEVVRTSRLAIAVARQMRLTGDECRRIGIAAVVHDVGRSTVPRAILDKPGRLTEAERAIVQHHPVSGEQIVLADELLAELAPIVRAHHERVDGSGYPDGLAGDRIPVGARVIAACDAFDAITHDRPYRTGLSVGTAIAVLREHAGRQWDGDVVRALTLVIAGRPERLGAPDALAAEELPLELGELLALVDAEI